MYNESSESVQCWRGWRCRQAPNTREADFFVVVYKSTERYFCEQKIDGFMAGELRELLVASRICGGAKENVSALSLSDARGRGLWVCSRHKRKAAGFSKDPRDVGACVTLNSEGTVLLILHTSP